MFLLDSGFKSFSLEEGRPTCPSWVTRQPCRSNVSSLFAQADTQETRHTIQTGRKSQDDACVYTARHGTTHRTSSTIPAAIQESLISLGFPYRLLLQTTILLMWPSSRELARFDYLTHLVTSHTHTWGWYRHAHTNTR